MDIFRVFKGKKNTKAPEHQPKKIPLFKQIDKNTEKIKQDLFLRKALSSLPTKRPPHIFPAQFLLFSTRPA